MTAAGTPYRRPAPVPMTPVCSLLRVVREGEGSLLSLLPIDAYRKPVTWLGYARRSILLINDPEIATRMRAEVERATDVGPVDFARVKQLDYVRNVFRETLRLYPPITFIPRVAAEATRIGDYRSRGARVRRRAGTAT